jgi:hypothetical protein
MPRLGSVSISVGVSPEVAEALGMCRGARIVNIHGVLPRKTSRAGVCLSAKTYSREPSEISRPDMRS